MIQVKLLSFLIFVDNSPKKLYRVIEHLIELSKTKKQSSLFQTQLEFSKIKILVQHFCSYNTTVGVNLGSRGLPNRLTID
jgi:hypothetical protein